MKHRSSPRRRSTAPVSTQPASPAILSGPVVAAGSRPAKFFIPAIALFAGVAIFTTAPSARAATKYWEPTGSTGTNASGTWNTSGVSWTTGLDRCQRPEHNVW